MRDFDDITETVCSIDSDLKGIARLGMEDDALTIHLDRYSLYEPRMEGVEGNLDETRVREVLLEFAAEVIRRLGAKPISAP